MAIAPRNLFEAATARGRVVNHGDIMCIIMDGNGAVIVDAQEFVQARKWAQSKLPTSNTLTDRARLLDQFTILVSRPGSVQSTRGNERQLHKIVKSMLAAGYEVSEWTLPQELRNIGRPPPPQPAKKKSRPEEEDADKHDKDAEVPQ